MKVTKIEDRLLDLYGISKNEAKHYWEKEKYIEVLIDKNRKAKKLKSKLLESNMMERDSNRINRITSAIDFNDILLHEVS